MSRGICTKIMHSDFIVKCKLMQKEILRVETQFRSQHRFFLTLSSIFGLSAELAIIMWVVGSVIFCCSVAVDNDDGDDDVENHNDDNDVCASLLLHSLLSRKEIANEDATTNTFCRHAFFCTYMETIIWRKERFLRLRIDVITGTVPECSNQQCIDYSLRDL
ncbi:hypothetical protein FF38_13322 [Lucilia cuprina]|uniref:Uncharacterized protein n=1 Tax=Lucilia cuprina TaxID=7375 RepID=A0A0L0BTY2_LUCCU|nr:hypothetical protein FF38_13322 [Lucilia cuprina]